MNKNDVIEMFRKGNSKNYIIESVINKGKANNIKYTKKESQEFVEQVLCNWWKTVV